MEQALRWLSGSTRLRLRRLGALWRPLQLRTQPAGPTTANATATYGRIQKRAGEATWRGVAAELCGGLAVIVRCCQQHRALSRLPPFPPFFFSPALGYAGKRRAVNVVGPSGVTGPSQGSASPTGPLSLSSTPSPPPGPSGFLASPPRLDAAVVSASGPATTSHDPVPTYQIHTEGIVIDGTVFGNIARFFNHSCDPNMKWIKVWSGKKYPLVAFFCRRNIPAGTELTWNYDTSVGAPPTHAVAGRRACARLL